MTCEGVLFTRREGGPEGGLSDEGDPRPVWPKLSWSDVVWQNFVLPNLVWPNLVWPNCVCPDLFLAKFVFAHIGHNRSYLGPKPSSCILHFWVCKKKDTLNLMRLSASATS